MVDLPEPVGPVMRIEPNGLAIPRSTLGSWVGSCGVQLQPLVDALKAQILSHSVVHADETPVQMLKPVKGKTLTTSVVTRNA